jgi:hypothetical protein
MVRDNTRINLKRENQPLVEYMPISSPTKCIACSLDTYRGALYPIFITFACVFAFISTLKGGCRVCTIDCCVVSNGFFWRELFYAGAYVCEKNCGSSKIDLLNRRGGARRGNVSTLPRSADATLLLAPTTRHSQRQHERNSTSICRLGF